VATTLNIPVSRSRWR